MVDCCITPVLSLFVCDTVVQTLSLSLCAATTAGTTAVKMWGAWLLCISRPCLYACATFNMWGALPVTAERTYPVHPNMYVGGSSSNCLLSFCAWCLMAWCCCWSSGRRDRSSSPSLQELHLHLHLHLRGSNPSNERQPSTAGELEGT